MVLRATKISRGKTSDDLKMVGRSDVVALCAIFSSSGLCRATWEKRDSAAITTEVSCSEESTTGYFPEPCAVDDYEALVEVA